MVVLQPLEDVGQETLRVRYLIMHLRCYGWELLGVCEGKCPSTSFQQKVGMSSPDGSSGGVAGRLAWGLAVT